MRPGGERAGLLRLSETTTPGCCIRHSALRTQQSLSPSYAAWAHPPPPPFLTTSPTTPSLELGRPHDPAMCPARHPGECGRRRGPPQPRDVPCGAPGEVRAARGRCDLKAERYALSPRRAAIPPPLPQRRAAAEGRTHPGWRVARRTPVSRLDLGAATPAHLALGPGRGRCLFCTQVAAKAREDASAVGIAPTLEHHPAREGTGWARRLPPAVEAAVSPQRALEGGVLAGRARGALASGRGAADLRTRYIVHRSTPPAWTRSR